MSIPLPKNLYADDASRSSSEATEHNAWNYEDRLIMATNANAQATLALAYEQRTANLIALWTDPNANESPLNDLDYGGLANQIKERLGLS